jgi:hypothetical protein
MTRRSPSVRRGSWAGLLAAVVLLASMLLAPGPAAAQPEAERARRHFFAGIGYFQQGNFGQAVVEFEASYRLRPAAGVLYNLGLAQKALRRYAEALVSLERYLAESRQLPAERVAAVRVHLEQMRGLVGEVQVPGVPPGGRLRVDGREVLSPAGLLTLTAGTHVLEVNADGFHPFRRELVVAARQRVVVPVALVAVPRTGRLEVVATPPAARISVDQRAVGTGQAQVVLPGGGHLLRVALDGFEPSQQEVVVLAGQQRRLDITLVRSRRFYRSWWFWTSIGVAVAGGTVGGVLGSRGPDRPRGSLPPGVQPLQGRLLSW